MNSRVKKLIRNIILISICVTFLFFRSGLYLSPIAAHKSSERSIHYGPSTIIKIVDFSKGKYLLCKYDKWVSCNTVLRKGLFWRFGSGVFGFENNINEPVSFTWGISGMDLRLYGAINDKSIQRIEIVFSNGDKYYINEFYEGLFLLSLENIKDDSISCKKVVGYNANHEVIYTAKSK